MLPNAHSCYWGTVFNVKKKEVTAHVLDIAALLKNAHKSVFDFL